MQILTVQALQSIDQSMVSTIYKAMHNSNRNHIITQRLAATLNVVLLPTIITVNNKMFKLIVFAVLLSLVAARPSILGPAIVHGPIVHTIPTAISHQSHVQIHTSPVITSVVSPVLHPVPILHAPLLHSHVVHAHHPIWLHR